MTPALMDGQNFVVQWDATDAEMRQFLKKYSISTERRCHVIEMCIRDRCCARRR